jgi:sugar (pentulose or hexulose) kinase
MSKENSMIALAFDLGGSSGKAVAGRFDGRRLHVHEIHRFRNDSVRVSGRLHWDILRLLHEIKQGIAAAATAGLGDIESLAVDAWGCDFGLLDRHGELIGNPYHYRDELARGAMEEVLQIVPAPRSSPAPVASSCRSTRSTSSTLCAKRGPSCSSARRRCC